MQHNNTTQRTTGPKHTPRPWATDIEIAAEIIAKEGVNSGRKNDNRLNGATVYVNHGPSKGSEIASLRHDPDDGLDIHCDEYKANAKLIAASPDLLAACQTALSFCAARGGNWADLEAALSKAITAATE